MALNSSYNQLKDTTCGIALAPMKTSISGPAPKPQDLSKDDIIDEALKFFRVNLFFKNYTYKGPADILLIYLYTFITHCLQLVENQEKEEGAKKIFFTLTREAVKAPKDIKFMYGYFKDPKDGRELDQFQSYLKQAKEELTVRLLRILYNQDGTKSIHFKHWVGLNKRKFMGYTFS